MSRATYGSLLGTYPHARWSIGGLTRQEGRRLVAMSKRVFSRRLCTIVSSRASIYAETTAHGRAGVSVVRISGPSAIDALQTLTRKETTPSPRMATLYDIVSPRSGEPIDAFSDGFLLPWA